MIRAALILLCVLALFVAAQTPRSRPAAAPIRFCLVPHEDVFLPCREADLIAGMTWDV